MPSVLPSWALLNRGTHCNCNAKVMAELPNIIHKYQGASPRRAAARLASAHARNFRGCMADIMSIGLQVECDSTAKGYIQIYIFLNKEKQTLESDAINHSNKLRHPAHDDEQQQQQPPHNFYVRVIPTTGAAAAASTTASSFSTIIISVRK